MAATERAVSKLVQRVEPVTVAIAREAARLRAEHSTLRLPDALVIATARETKAELVLTGDRRLGPVDDRIQVVSQTFRR